MLKTHGLIFFAFSIREKNIPFYERRGHIADFYVHALFLFIQARQVNLMSKYSKPERIFQAELIRELKHRFAGCLIMKLDASYIQGIPDLLILYKNKWATLECKKDSNSKKQPNQNYYVELMNDMSFSCFVSPDNKEDVINDLQQAFESQ